MFQEKNWIDYIINKIKSGKEICGKKIEEEKKEREKSRIISLSLQLE